MAQILHVGFWKDTGFMDGGVEVPKLSDCGDSTKLPTEGQYSVSERFYPSKGRIFSELKIEGEYEKFHRFTYIGVHILYARPFDGTTSAMWYFGWVDSVEMLRDEDESGQVLVKWHVDPWRTYGHLARFGSGIIRNKPSTVAQLTADQPLQNLPYIWNKYDSELAITEPDRFTYRSKEYLVYWLCVFYADDEGEVSTPRYTVMPLFFNTDGTMDTRLTDEPHVYPEGGLAGHLSADPYYTLSAFSSLTGISTSKISGAYLLPKCPMSYSISSRDSGSVNLTVTDGTGRRCHKDSYTDTSGTGFTQTWYAPSLIDPVRTVESESENIASSEFRTVNVRDCHALSVYTLPPRIPCIKHKWYYEPSAVSMKLCVAFLPAGMEQLWDDMHALRSMGLVADVPAMRISLASNSYSDYVASGQRDFEAQQRRMSAEMGFVNGAAQSTIAGSLKGEGALAAGLGSAATAFAVNRVYESGIQENLDSKHALQFDTIAYPGDDLQWMRLSRCDKIVMTKIDDYSYQRLEDWISLNGITVNEAAADCTSVCSGTGPVRIEDLIVKGAIPSEAREYIRSRFIKGVRLI